MTSLNDYAFAFNFNILSPESLSGSGYEGGPGCEGRSGVRGGSGARGGSGVWGYQICIMIAFIPTNTPFYRILTPPSSPKWNIYRPLFVPAIPLHPPNGIYINPSLYPPFPFTPHIDPSPFICPLLSLPRVLAVQIVGPVVYVAGSQRIWWMPILKSANAVRALIRWACLEELATS